jgi:hypothetical protein
MQTQPVNHRYFGWREGIKLVSFIKTTLQDLKHINYRLSRSSAKVQNVLTAEVATINRQEGSTETYSNLSLIGSAGMQLQITSSAASACPPIFVVPITGSVNITAIVPNSKVSPDYIRWEIISSPHNLLTAPSGMLTLAGLGTLTQVTNGISNTATYTGPITAGIYYLRATTLEDPTATLVMYMYVGTPVPTQLDYASLIQASRSMIDFARRTI